MTSKFIHVAINGKISSFFMAELPPSPSRCVLQCRLSGITVLWMAPLASHGPPEHALAAVEAGLGACLSAFHQSSSLTAALRDRKRTVGRFHGWFEDCQRVKGVSYPDA